MKERLKAMYRDFPLAGKIRISYLIIAVPMLTFLIICFFNLWTINRRYGDMVEAAGIASEFSLDFKKDFDYETYLLIVENKTIEESELGNLINEADRIISNLKGLEKNSTGNSRLKSAEKYLNNLEIYKARIEDNLRIGNMYEDNIEIWENDVQIVTELLRESMMEYIYYEIQDMETQRARYQNFYMRLIIIMLVAFVAITISTLVLSIYIPLSITRPVRTLTKVADQVANGDLSVRAQPEEYDGAEAAVLGKSINAMIDTVNRLLSQVTEEQISLRNAELALLQAQINPHFLYNTLDAIVWLAEAGEGKKVVSMVESLSEFFRSSLSQGKDVVRLYEDLSHVKSYLEIQKMRYQDILEFEMDVPEELKYCEIPKITIQPIVENAIYHGIKNKRGGGTIKVTGKRENDRAVIMVSDNGIGMMSERLQTVARGIKEKSPQETDIYGLYNVNERIRLKFGDDYGISIDSAYGEGTNVKIVLPFTTLCPEEKNQPES